VNQVTFTLNEHISVTSELLITACPLCTTQLQEQPLHTHIMFVLQCTSGQHFFLMDHWKHRSQITHSFTLTTF